MLKSESSGLELQVYSIRWAIIVMFIFAGAANALVLLSFAPITNLADKYWDNVGTSAINLLAVSFQIMYLPGTMLALYISSKYNLRMIMLAGGALTTVGCLVRFIGTVFVSSGMSADASYGLVLLGTFIVATAQPFYINMPAKIAAAWFPVKERDLSTTLCSLANPLGSAIGSVIPAYIVYNGGAEDDAPGPIKGVDTLMLVHLIVAGIALAVNFVAFRSQPPKPPSYSAMQMQNNEQSQERKGMFAELLLLLKNPNYLCLLFSFTIVLSNLNALAALLNQLPGGHTNTELGLTGAILILSGFVGALMTGFILDFTKAYRTVVTVAYFAAVFSWGLFMTSCGHDQVTFWTFSAALLGFTLLPTSKLLVAVFVGSYSDLSILVQFRPPLSVLSKLPIPPLRISHLV
jgi:FLVCR family MFS transporter 7